MDTKHSSILVLLTLISLINCHGKQLADDKLLEISQRTFEQWKAVNNQNLAKEVIREGMAHLSDAERTRAMALRIFDLDTKDHGRMRFNAPSSMQNVLFDDPSLISDPTELKKMMESETDPRRFFILASMASHFIQTQKSDFVVEVAPMLFRHEPLAKMVGEYYFNNLSDASFFAYEMIVRNLEILNADFIPADEKLPYPDRISILVKWLKENFPGCEQLGEEKTATQNFRRINANNGPEVRREKRISVPSEDKSSKQTSSSMPWWQVSMVATVLIGGIGIWLKLKSPITPL